MNARRVASTLFPESIVWVEREGGFVWLQTAPSAVRDSDELHVSWVRWTNRHGRHCIHVNCWVKTDVQIVSSTSTHIRWVEPATPVHHRPVLDHPPPRSAQTRDPHPR